MSVPASKVCKRCEVEKLADQFSRQTVKGHEYLHSYCKPCACVLAAEAWRKRPKKPRKRALLSEHSKVCRKCGVEKPTKDFGTVKPGRGDRFNRPSRCKACRLSRNVQWHMKNGERSKENHVKWCKENAAHVRSYNRRVREANPQKHALIFKRWAQRNSAYLAAKQNRRRLSKMRATPPWLSLIDMAMIEEFYEIAAAKGMQTGIPHEVDHTAPLKGETVCGLHVPWNLQVLTASENASKKNKLQEGL